MEKFIKGMAEILETSSERISLEFRLNGGDAPWDSLAIVSTIALIDEIFDLTVDGTMLSNCETVDQIIKLIESTKPA
jgi:acyl carrier protein